MIMSKTDLSRRHFLGAAVSTAAAAAALPGLAHARTQIALPEKWDMETDVVVLGCGGAGIEESENVPGRCPLRSRFPPPL